MSDWDGEDRRRADPRVEAATQKMDAAMAEVRHLYGSVEELAGAVARSMPRDEIEARAREQKERERQFRDQARLIAAGLALLLVILVAFSMAQVRKLENRLDRGHDVILCVLKVPEAQRTDAAVLTCQVQK